MEDMLTKLAEYGDILGYIALFLYSLGGGMVAIIAAGVLSFNGQMDLTISIIIAFVANAAGDSLLFYMSRYNKPVMMPYLKKHRRKLALSHILMKRHGDKIIFFQKFVYGIKTLIPLAIGLTKYSFTKFNILNILSALVWSIGLGYASYSAGEVMTRLGSYIGENPWLMPIIVGSLLGLLWLYFNRVTRKKK